jgi:hypothetical protein
VARKVALFAATDVNDDRSGRQAAQVLADSPGVLGVKVRLRLGQMPLNGEGGTLVPSEECPGDRRRDSGRGLADIKLCMQSRGYRAARNRSTDSSRAFA